MDPNTALLNILRGYEVEDHVEALREWISRGGFRPEIRVSLHDSEKENWPYSDLTFVDFTRVVRANFDGVQYFALHADGKEELITTTAWNMLLNDFARYE